MSAHFPRLFNRLPAAAMVTASLLLAGCFGDNQSWHGKDISRLMPELTFELTDTSGDTVTADATDGEIRMLFFGFTSCPDVCPTTLQKLSRAVRDMPEKWQDDTRIVFVSVDPRRDTPERIASYVDFFSDRAIGLTGEEKALRELSKRYRTTFGYEERGRQLQRLTQWRRLRLRPRGQCPPAVQARTECRGHPGGPDCIG